MAELDGITDQTRELIEELWLCACRDEDIHDDGMNEGWRIKLKLLGYALGLEYEFYNHRAGMTTN